MATKSYAEKIAETKILIDGLREISSQLPSGITEEGVSKLEELRNQVQALNSEQESLKAELKKKTEVMQNQIKEMDKLYADMKKRIKLDIDQKLWGKFGIEDKR